MPELTAQLAIDCHDVIGEGPAWDAAGEQLIWSDNALGVIHVASADGAGGWRERRTWQLGRPIGDAVPRAKGGFVVCGGTEIFTLDEAGQTAPFVTLDADPALVRLNEAKCDPQGRLWAGTMAHDFSRGGALYRIDPDRRVTRILEGVSVANGLDWSRDGRTFYFIDSLIQGVDAFDFDGARGALSRRRRLVSIEAGAGGPDGMTIDAEDCLWVAIMGSGELRRYAPDGQFLTCVRLSAPAVTSCAFGGVDGGELFITSAAIRLPEVFVQLGFSAEVVAHSHAAPGAGGLFVCRPGPKGVAAVPFAG